MILVIAIGAIAAGYFDEARRIPYEDNEVGANPVRNFQDGYGEKVDNLRADDLDKKFSVRRLACFSCPVPGSHWFRVSDGEFEGTEGEGSKQIR